MVILPASPTKQSNLPEPLRSAILCVCFRESVCFRECLCLCLCMCVYE